MEILAKYRWIYIRIYNNSCIFFKSSGQSQSGVARRIIIELISSIFFSISNSANKRMVEFFDKLRLDSNTVNSIDLLKSIKDDNTRDELAVKLSLHLIGIDENNICKHSKSICVKEESSN